MNTSEVRLRSVGTALPGHAVDNAELTAAFGMGAQWQEWVDTFVGAGRRHFSRDLRSGERTNTLVDLAATAAERALAAAGVQPSEVDLLTLGTATPDLLMPATVNMVADRLGINDVRTYQLQSGCSGAVQSMELAHDLLRLGPHRLAVAIGADSCAKHLDVGFDVSTLPPPQLINLLLFGDGAGAAVLGTGDGPGRAVFRTVFTRVTGLGREPGQTLEWFGLADRGQETAPAGENYKAIETMVPRLAAEILTEVLERVGWKETEFDYLLPPQLSGRMTARIVEELGVPTAQEVSCIERTGNTGNALPFLQLEQALAELSAGDRAVGIAVESSKWIKAGFALEGI